MQIDSSMITNTRDTYYENKTVKKQFLPYKKILLQNIMTNNATLRM